MAREAARLWIVACSILGGMHGAAADESEGARIATTCAACHRLDHSAAGIPPIVGLDPKRLAAMMLVFKVTEHPNHIMHAVSLALSDDEVTSVAHYLAALGKEAKVP
jgi:sulfide dehydrogenase cytochrome subunit